MCVCVYSLRHTIIENEYITSQLHIDNVRNGKSWIDEVTEEVKFNSILVFPGGDNNKSTWSTVFSPKFTPQLCV